MSYFSVTILGCGSATPTLRHMPSAQLVRYRQQAMLVDCGEGAQLQLRRYGCSFAKISHIFISHLHGDHFLGLPGLLSTMALHDVQGTVTVHTFAEGAGLLKNILDMLCRERPYKLQFDIIDPANPGTVYSDANLEVVAFPLNHRVPCVGYIFREKPKKRHIDGESVRFYGVAPPPVGRPTGGGGPGRGGRPPTPFLFPPPWSGVGAGGVCVGGFVALAVFFFYTIL